MIEPFAFLIIKLGAGLAATRHRELLNQFVHREHFLFGAWIPTQQSQEIDDGFGEITGFAITFADLARSGILPVEREDREIEPVAVALGKLAFAVGFALPSLSEFHMGQLLDQFYHLFFVLHMHE